MFMRKGSNNKERISITINPILLDKLKKKLSKRMIKLSTYIEYLVNEDLKNEK
jgi:predicted DNA binding CopG/RHH family protein